MADPEFMYIIAPYEGSDVVVSACHSKRQLREDLRDLHDDWPGCVVEVCKLGAGSAEEGTPSYEHERWATVDEFLSARKRRSRRTLRSEVQRG